MHDNLMINNMYAAYSASSAALDNKKVSDLSRMLSGRAEAKEKKATDEEAVTKSMDKVIISAEALARLRKSLT